MAVDEKHTVKDLNSLLRLIALLATSVLIAACTGGDSSLASNTCSAQQSDANDSAAATCTSDAAPAHDVVQAQLLPATTDTVSATPHGSVSNNNIKQNELTTTNSAVKPEPVKPVQSATVVQPAKSGLTQSAAARFLTQATYGPTRQSIQRLQNLGSYEKWIDQQVNATISLQLPYVQQRYRAERAASNRPQSEIDQYFNINSTTGARHDAWWQAALTGPDQLRQRIAFALSEILVVSDVDISLLQAQFGVADYYDTLARHAFGNYRELLEAVTLHPVMGKFLGAIRNERGNPDTNTRPDENFAREVMQLFSIGVSLLNQDGTLLLDADKQPIASYTQSDIIEYAKVFTGWNYANIDWDLWDGYGDVVQPMVPVETYHEPGGKTLINGSVTASDTRGDLSAALDSLFNHRNVGPWLARRLIQRLITSNPTPNYIARIAAVFNDNGKGVRGDLAATVKAILLDPEARHGHINHTHVFGKLREPLLRITHSWRAFSATQTPGAAYGLLSEEKSYKTPFDGGLYNLERVIHQAPLRAPSVFNFYLPDYSPPGTMRNRSLFGPEFQLLTESATLGIVNMVNTHIEGNWQNQPWTTLNFDHEISLASSPTALLDHLDILLLSGGMTPSLKEILYQHLTDETLSAVSSADKVRDVTMLILNSPEYLIQK